MNKENMYPSKVCKRTNAPSMLRFLDAEEMTRKRNAFGFTMNPKFGKPSRNLESRVRIPILKLCQEKPFIHVPQHEHELSPAPIYRFQALWRLCCTPAGWKELQRSKQAYLNTEAQPEGFSS